MSELISGNRVELSTLISGKEALIALANGETVEVKRIRDNEWKPAQIFGVSVFTDSETTSFRLKPRTTTLNGIEVPATFEPKNGELFYYINSSSEVGYSEGHTTKWSKFLQFGVWRKEDEIKQVVEVLRKVFNSQ